MATTTTPPLDLCTVLTESKRILNAHSRHFLALSVLFLLPLSFSVTIFPTLQDLLSQPSSHNFKTLLSLTSPKSNDTITTKTIVLSIIFVLFTVCFSLLAVGSITYSVLHGFYGRPVKLISAIKSSFLSFFPLFITVVFAQIIVFGFILVSGSLLFLVCKGIELLGFRVEYSSPYFTVFCGVVLMLVLVCLEFNWALVSVVVVVESRWGLEALKRSSFLMKGMRKVGLSLLSFFGFLAVILMCTVSLNFVEILGFDNTTSSGGNGWRSWGFVLQIVVVSSLLTLLFLYNVASYTILYMYCKAVHGELALEIAEEFAREYVSLPFDDEKVPHVVYVSYT